MSTETLQQRRMSGVGVLGREILAGLVPVLVVLVLWEIGYLLVPHNTYLHGPIEVRLLPKPWPKNLNAMLWQYQNFQKKDQHHQIIPLCSLIVRTRLGFI